MKLYEVMKITSLTFIALYKIRKRTINWEFDLSQIGTQSWKYKVEFKALYQQVDFKKRDKKQKIIKKR